jgi:biopolymer transport protein ExbD/biopolymer transport protein TolR
MGINMGKTGSSEVADINMTPMIDVLLVLLVIFIIVQMNMQRTFDIQLPVDKKDQAPVINNTAIILQIEPNGVVHVNTQQVQPAALEAFLRDIYSQRPDKVIFIKAGPEVPYGDVINYIDTARAAGVTVVGAVLNQLAGAAGAP